MLQVLYQSYHYKKCIIYFLFEIWKDFLFFIFWSIIGTGTSSEKGQYSKWGRSFGGKNLESDSI